jgi:hypothetical protein
VLVLVLVVLVLVLLPLRKVRLLLAGWLLVLLLLGGYPYKGTEPWRQRRWRRGPWLDLNNPVFLPCPRLRLSLPLLCLPLPLLPRLLLPLLPRLLLPLLLLLPPPPP